MAMHNQGLTKLIEECGELTQILAKKMAYYGTDIHPDDKGSMKIRIEEEMADVMASIEFVANKLQLDVNHIQQRSLKKLKTFREWDKLD